MGYGSYTSSTFSDYSTSRGISYDSYTGKMDSSVSHQDIFKSSRIVDELNPYKVTRECCDSEAHPYTKPVILALDVTGSMGDAATEVAKSLGVIMGDLYDKVTDIQFMTMGIGDFAYDRSPLQVSQFESDIRINEQLDKIWFEFGGGGNLFESYTAAWKFGLDHTKLDCFDKRHTKATLITIGDEMINPYIDGDRWKEVTGETVQADIETKELFKAVSEKFNIYHIHVDHRGRGGNYNDKCVNSFKAIIGDQNVFTCTVEDIDKTITNIILDSVNNSTDSFVDENPVTPVANTSGIKFTENGEIDW